MDTLTTVAAMQAWSDGERVAGRRIAVVPTMGALHDGHLALVDRAHQCADVVVATIFVNPTQFAPGEDLDKYPRDLDGDLAKLSERGVSAVFTPARDKMYPDGVLTSVAVGDITGVLEGATRPTHFAGVTLIVTKLFHAVRPHVAVFGRKDAQQAIVIRRMTADLDFGIEIVVAPTVREADGLALSSRNRYLSDAERGAALVLSRALRGSFDAYRSGERRAATLMGEMERMIGSEPLVRMDYLAIVDMGSFAPVPEIEPGTLIAGAMYVGTTRLIDNWWVDDSGDPEF